MPHQQQQIASSESQEMDPSTMYPQQGSYYQYSPDSMAYTVAAPYGDFPYHGYGMMNPNTNYPLYYPNPNAMGEWSNSATGMESVHDSNSNTNSNTNSKADSNTDNDTMKRNRQRKTKGRESDEEAAATGLLMAAGQREENVETMQAAVREKKRAMHHQNSNQILSLSKGVKKDKSKSGDKQSISSSPAKSGEKDSAKGEQVKEKENSSVIIKDFPIVLHKVLTKSEYAGSVLEWLTHGKTWRILRWDKLSDSIIPTYFPELCDNNEGSNNEKSSRSMNRFIRQIKAWGFKENREIGPDLGSFQHEFFIKIAPELCRYMKAAKRKDIKRPHEANLVSPPRRSHKRKHSSQSSSSNHSYKEFPSKRGYKENREEASSPGNNRSDPRGVRFDSDNSPVIQTNYGRHRQTYESPTTNIDMQLNYVSPSSQTSSNVVTPRLSLKSNRGGSRAFPRVANFENKVSSASSSNHRSAYPVSTRGRGNRNVSSRGRLHKGKRPAVGFEKNEDTPMILKK